MTWILVVLVYVGGLTDHEANAISTISGFVSKAECEKAGVEAREALSPGRKRATFVCLGQSK